VSETTVLALVLVVFLLVAGGLLGALSLVPKTAPAARGLWPAMASEVVVVGLVLGVVWPGGVVTGLAVALLAGRTAWEAATVALGGGDERRALAVGVAAGLAALLAAFGGSYGPIAAVALVAAATVLAWRTRSASSSLFLFVFPLLPLVAFAGVATAPSGGAVLLLAFLLVETMDSAAVLGGRLFGRHKIFPRLSPRKTLEGLLTGAGAVLLAALVYGRLVVDWSLGRILVVTVSVAVATVAGDLAASWIKRRAGVKDYPLVHATQGGVLDTVDAWLVAAPTLALVLRLS